MKLFPSRHAHYGYWHWCPACEDTHRLPQSWTFNGNHEKPTFAPSFKHEWSRLRGPLRVCHYIVTNGRIAYCGDCTHAMAGQEIDFPEIPDAELKGLREGDF